MTTIKPIAALGVDIGGMQIKAVALTNDEILETFDCPSRASDGPDGVAAAVEAVVEHFRTKKISFSKIGIGCAGSVDSQNGIVRNSPNFAAWKDVALGDRIRAFSGVPVTVENDANCAMFAEWKLGNAQGALNTVLLTFGTGIGGGLILNGELYRGSTGTAAELGHFSIHADGIPCPCGNIGCFERYCSTAGLREALPKIHSALEVFQNSQIPEYRRALDKFFMDLNVGLTGIANIFDPDFILLGGGISEGFKPYLKDISKWVKTHAFPIVGQHVEIRLTRHGNLSGAMGAALLAR